MDSYALKPIRGDTASGAAVNGVFFRVPSEAWLDVCNGCNLPSERYIDHISL